MQRIAISARSAGPALTSARVASVPWAIGMVLAHPLGVVARFALGHVPNVVSLAPIATTPRGFLAGANRGILASMSWHRTPTDDAWKQAHLAMVEGLGKRLWLGCDGCQHTVMIAPRELADRHGLDMHTPLQTLSRALRCTRCGEGRGKAGLSRTATGPGVDRKNGPSVRL